MDIYQRNYRKLLQLIPTLYGIQSATKLSALGYMDLDLDIVERQHKKLVIALGHHYQHRSGDMMPDPDMTIAIYSVSETAEVLTYQDCFGYRQVGPPDQQTLARWIERFSGVGSVVFVTFFLALRWFLPRKTCTIYSIVASGSGMTLGFIAVLTFRVSLPPHLGRIGHHIPQHTVLFPDLKTLTKPA